MSDTGGADGTRGGRHQHRAGWPSRRVQLALLFAAVAVATIAVPPLVAPRRGAAPPDGPAAAAAGTGPGAATGTGAPTGTGTPAGAAGSKPTSGPAAFVAVTVEAEAPGNIRSGQAKVVRCDTCDGGGRVGYLAAESQLTVRLPVATAGDRTITVVYETDGPRTIKVSVNGLPSQIRHVTGTGWEVPESFQFTAAVPAGDLTLTFYNDQAPAPDIDRVVLT